MVDAVGKELSGMGEEGGREVENNRERATEEGKEERELQSNETNMYPKE